ncbi:hypothetical protein DH2020_003916 [Rehmannia glutinosa]|uniref:FAD synthase n=1 Tax=Rehmannia glutinosa TaxID=99300 RepID=A0ABR0XN50_REHGL
MMMSGCRISQQLREYNPRQFGICSFNGNKQSSFYFTKAPQTPPLPLRRFPFSLNFTTSSTSPAENDRDPPSEGISSLAGGIVALGKFDALHIGHRELAIQAAKIGVPFLLSFVGMAEILGWEPSFFLVKACLAQGFKALRLFKTEEGDVGQARTSAPHGEAPLTDSLAPIVAKCDRKRVLSSWAPLCGNIIPKEFHIEFSKVRNLTPQQFVEKLSEELGVRGVVAGQNYRFGYRAAGNASDLERLCKEYGMRAAIINSIMDKNQESGDRECSNSKEQGQVSSTRVRHALANGDMEYVSKLLGRHHRLMLMVKNKEKFFRDRKWLSAPRSCLLNLPPKEGLYKNCSLVIGDEGVPCRVIIDTTDIHLELDELAAAHLNISDQNLELLGIDFGESKV